MLIAQIYRPPYDVNPFTQTWLDYMENSLEKGYAENKGIILMGDLNINVLKVCPLGRKWSEVHHNFNLEQVIDKPTRIT